MRHAGYVSEGDAGGGSGAAPYELAGALSGPEGLIRALGGTYSGTMDEMISATERMTSEVGSLFDRMGTDARAVYAGMGGAGRAYMDAVGKASLSFFRKETGLRISLGNVAEYTARMGSAAAIDSLVAEARVRASYYGALALGLAAVGNFSGAAKAGASALLFGSLTGLGMGASMALKAEADERMSRSSSGASSGLDTGAGDPWGRSSGGSGSGASGSSSGGGYKGTAGVGIGTGSGFSSAGIGVSITIINQGAVVYGAQGGTRTWAYQELMPLINEGIGNGTIQIPR
jgi:hypothetical protein